MILKANFTFRKAGKLNQQINGLAQRVSPRCSTPEAQGEVISEMIRKLENMPRFRGGRIFFDGGLKLEAD